MLLLISFALELIVLSISSPIRKLLTLISDSLMALALPFSWFYLMFFAGGIHLTGPFVSMIQYMLVQDMRQFSIIYLIFIYGFSQGECGKVVLVTSSISIVVVVVNINERNVSL